MIFIFMSRVRIHAEISSAAASELLVPSVRRVMGYGSRLKLLTTAPSTPPLAMKAILYAFEGMLSASLWSRIKVSIHFPITFPNLHAA